MPGGIRNIIKFEKNKSASRKRDADFKTNASRLELSFAAGAGTSLKSLRLSNTASARASRLIRNLKVLCLCVKRENLCI